MNEIRFNVRDVDKMHIFEAFSRVMIGTPQDGGYSDVYELTEDVFQFQAQTRDGQLSLNSSRVRDCYPFFGLAEGIFMKDPGTTRIECLYLGEKDKEYLAGLLNKGLERAANTRLQRSPLALGNIIPPKNLRSH
jgi:hypothetical protein